MRSSRYTIFYAFGVSVIVAVALASAATGLKSRQEANAAAARRSAILESVMVVNPETVSDDYRAYITEMVFDFDGNRLDDVNAFDLDIRSESRKPDSERRYPVYAFERGGDAKFIIPLQGAGLWGPLSAYLALESDLDSVSGVVFDHEKETPGLGAEISTPAFESRFTGKRLFGPDGSFRSIRVVKGPGPDNDDPHEVDGLTGATMTMNGVSRMLEADLELYQRIFGRLGS